MSEVEKLIRLGSVLAESEDCDLSEIGDDISNLAHFWKKEIDQLRQKLEAAEAQVKHEQLQLKKTQDCLLHERNRLESAVGRARKAEAAIREAREQKPNLTIHIRNDGGKSIDYLTPISKLPVGMHNFYASPVPAMPIQDDKENIEKLNHVLKMNKNVMTTTGVVYIQQVIDSLSEVKPS